MELFQPEPVIWIQTTMGPGWQRPMDIVTALGGAWGIILVAGLATQTAPAVPDLSASPRSTGT